MRLHRPIQRSLAVLACLCAGHLASAQLAITEVMSSAANSHNGSPATQESDFWELTNFGTSAINLTGYKWTDDTTMNPTLADPTPFVGVTILPGESVIVLYTNVTASEAAFRTWWGAPAANVRVLPHNHRGFSSGGDATRLWDANDQLVDAVDYAAATRGRTFVYYPADGRFGLLSTNGVNGAYTAATTDDVGSPGTTSGAVPLTITQPPTNLTVNAGSPALLTIAATGLPKPRYQWLFNGNPLTGETGTSLAITNAQPMHAGAYRVVLTNGVQVATSVVAQLTVNPAPAPPIVTLLPRSLGAYEWQTVTFTVAAIGNPAPRYQWRFNGADLPFETNPELTLYAVTPANSGTYSVNVYNSAGSTNVAAQLTVTTKPRVVITEVMSSEGTNSSGGVVGQDWWELTNLDTFPVNLLGWMWDDDETRAGAFVITNDITLQPGQSAILVESLTPEQFRAWWGEANLSPELKIIRYTGNGLSSAGDVISVWNAAATDDSDRVVTLAFGAATAGISFGYNPTTDQFGGLSTVGQFGTFASATGNDIGSPGYLYNRPSILSLKSVAPGVELTWTTRPNVPYQLRSAASLAGPWSVVTNRIATGSTMTNRDATGAGNRFYRVVENP